MQWSVASRCPAQQDVVATLGERNVGEGRSPARDQGLAAEFKTKVAAWEKKYPAGPKAIVVLRLREFLAESATVDFTAKTALSKEKKKQTFVNPEHELKSLQWKMMYRAGKPAVEAARAAAQDWLNSLGG